MPSGISPRGNAQKCLILLGKINFLQKRRQGKACCDLRRGENFRQHPERRCPVSLLLVFTLYALYGYSEPKRGDLLIAKDFGFGSVINREALEHFANSTSFRPAIAVERIGC